MNANPRFWDRIARRYNRSSVPSEADYQHKLAVTRQYLRADSEVVEFGCGTGITAVAHAPYVRRIRAVDISQAMLAFGREKARAAGVDNIDFVQGTLFDLKLVDASVDAVLGLSILHLLPERGPTLAEVYRVLKPGGVFVSSTACINEKLPWLRYLAPLGQALRLMPLVRFFGRDDLKAEITAAGFEIDYDWVPDASPMVSFLVVKKPS